MRDISKNSTAQYEGPKSEEVKQNIKNFWADVEARKKQLAQEDIEDD